jgi:hypothetical protein
VSSSDAVLLCVDGFGLCHFASAEICLCNIMQHVYHLGEKFNVLTRVQMTICGIDCIVAHVFCVFIVLCIQFCNIVKSSELFMEYIATSLVEKIVQYMQPI